MAAPAHVIEVDESVPLLDRNPKLNEEKEAQKRSPSPTAGDTYLTHDSYIEQRHPHLRQSFLRRVYGILSGQLVLNVLVVAACMYIPALREVCVQHPAAMLWISFIPTIICLLGMFAFKDRYPVNGFLLLAFTFFESLAIGEICALYQANGVGVVVLEAFGLTLFIFLGLTAFAMQSKIDFSFMGGFLSIALISMIFWGLLQILFGWHQVWLYSWLGALLFSGFVLFDTWMIMQRYGYDDYLMAAVELYLDFVNLFLNILRIMSSGNDR